MARRGRYTPQGKTTEAPVVGSPEGQTGRPGRPRGYGGRVTTGGRAGLTDAALGANNRSSGGKGAPSTGVGGGAGSAGGGYYQESGLIETTTYPGGGDYGGPMGETPEDIIDTITRSPTPMPTTGMPSLAPIAGSTPLPGAPTRTAVSPTRTAVSPSRTYSPTPIQPVARKPSGSGITTVGTRAPTTSTRAPATSVARKPSGSGVITVKGTSTKPAPKPTATTVARKPSGSGVTTVRGTAAPKKPAPKPVIKRPASVTRSGQLR